MPHRTYKGRNAIRLAEFTPAWLNNPDLPENTRKRSRSVAALWLFAGIAILVCDGLALAHFANNYAESLVLGILTIPSAAFVILCALEALK
jgi:hypothetical protein